MTIDDLIPIGKLSKAHREYPEFLLFKPAINFESDYLEFKDIFLLFKDNSVRYVTVESVREDKSIWIQLQEKDVIQEVMTKSSALVCLGDSDINKVSSEKKKIVSGMKVILNDEVIAEVTGIDNYGAHDVITVKSTNGDEFMIPDVEDFVILKDYASNQIVVRNVAQFREL